MKPSGNEMRQSRRITPSSGFSNPAIMLITVLLPVPLGARMPRLRPRSTRKDTRSRITLRCVPVQKDLLTESNSSIQFAPILLWPHPLGRGLIRHHSSRNGYYAGMMSFITVKQGHFVPKIAKKCGRAALDARFGAPGSGFGGAGERQARGFQMLFHDVCGAFGFTGADRVEDLAVLHVVDADGARIEREMASTTCSTA